MDIVVCDHGIKGRAEFPVNNKRRIFEFVQPHANWKIVPRRINIFYFHKSWLWLVYSM